jgi:hypothetical protein
MKKMLTIGFAIKIIAVNIFFRRKIIINEKFEKEVALLMPGVKILPNKNFVLDDINNLPNPTLFQTRFKRGPALYQFYRTNTQRLI